MGKEMKLKLKRSRSDRGVDPSNTGSHPYPGGPRYEGDLGVSGGGRNGVKEKTEYSFQYQKGTSWGISYCALRVYSKRPKNLEKKWNQNKPRKRQVYLGGEGKGRFGTSKGFPGAGKRGKKRQKQKNQKNFKRGNVRESVIKPLRQAWKILQKKNPEDRGKERGRMRPEEKPKRENILIGRGTSWTYMFHRKPSRGFGGKKIRGGGPDK